MPPIESASWAFASLPGEGGSDRLSRRRHHCPQELQVPFALSLALLLAAPLPPVTAQDIPRETIVHLGLTLRTTHPSELRYFQRAQQDPASPEYHHWLTPAQFGERFGQPAEVYAHAADWLGSTGMKVTLAPNRTFLEALGSAAQAEKLLGIHLKRVEGKPVAVHAPDRRPSFPPEVRPLVVHLSGLDTRVHFRRRIPEQGGAPAALGPQDLRRFYGVQPLLDRGYVGQGQQLVVLSTAEAPGNGPNPVDIEYFLSNVSDARAEFIQRVLPNPQNDADTQAGGGVEFELDVEMQSVGSPGADSITLDVAPASEVFTTGAQDIVNNLSGATAVSVSLGNCEQ
ncbi:MAG: protease pro-enzyme activation domain-containing protein, partial [Deltaproteobacteria bacterium]